MARWPGAQAVYRFRVDIQIVEVPRGRIVADIPQHIVPIRHDFGDVRDRLPHVHDDLWSNGLRLMTGLMTGLMTDD